MDSYTHKVRRQFWIEQIRLCNESGIPKKEWLRQHGLSQKSFYYWQKKLRMELALEVTKRESVFVQIPDPCSKTGSAVIHCGNAEIEITDSISDDLLVRILKAVSNA